MKEREHRGYQYEAADASFELLLRREAGQYSSLFRLESFRVITEKRADGQVETEATIKIWVDGQRYVRTAEGNGPVNALDKALRLAITDLHPHLADIELTDYKVRILDSHDGTGAITRVLLDSSDGQESWGTIGVSENIIEASWEALVDSLEYAFQPAAVAASRLSRLRSMESGAGLRPRCGGLAHQIALAVAQARKACAHALGHLDCAQRSFSQKLDEATAPEVEDLSRARRLQDVGEGARHLVPPLAHASHGHGMSRLPPLRSKRGSSTSGCDQGRRNPQRSARG